MCETHDQIKAKFTIQDKSIELLSNNIEDIRKELETMRTMLNDFIIDFKANRITRKEFDEKVDRDELKEFKEYFKGQLNNMKSEYRQGFKETNEKLENIELNMVKLNIMGKVVYGLIGAILMYVLNTILHLI